MGSITLTVPQNGQANSIADPNVSTDLTILQTLLNGNVDSTNISPSAAIQRSQLQYLGALAYTFSTAGTVSMVAGNTYSQSANSFMTLPTPVLHAMVRVFNPGGYAIVVQMPAGPGGIYGLGMSTSGATTSFQLSAVGSCATLLSDGANWLIVDGMQDTGWLSMAPYFASGVGAGANTPQFRQQADRVWLRGDLSIPGGSSGIWLTGIPANFRPSSGSGSFIATNNGGQAYAGQISGNQMLGQAGGGILSVTFSGSYALS